MDWVKSLSLELEEIDDVETLYMAKRQIENEIETEEVDWESHIILYKKLYMIQDRINKIQNGVYLG